MRRICSTCLEEYEGGTPEHVIIDENLLQKCPKIKCEGSIVDFHDKDVPLMKKLREKGYDILDLSTGSTFHKNASISYIEFNKKYIFNTLPEGFDLVDTSDPNIPEDIRQEFAGSTVFVSTIVTEDELDLAEELIYAQLSLIDWIQKLPDLNKRKEEEKTDEKKEIGLTNKEEFKKIFDELYNGVIEEDPEY